MKKNYFIFLFAFIFLNFNLLEAREEKDWTLDLKTSTLIPKYAGIVKELRGEAKIEEKNLQKGSKVYPHDVIKTEEKSFIKLELIDETLLTLGPKSEFQIESWNYRTKNDRDAIFYLIRGKLRAEIKSKAREKDQLKIKSPLVAMGIRGTEVLINNNFSGNKEVSQIALLEGKIQLLLLELQEKINLFPGDYVEVIKGLTKTLKNARTLTIEEKNTLGTPQLADQFNLLPDAVIGEELTPSGDFPQEDKTAKEDSSGKNKKNASKSQSLKEKIKVLNKVREENLKKQ